MGALSLSPYISIQSIFNVDKEVCGMSNTSTNRKQLGFNEKLKTNNSKDNNRYRKYGYMTICRVMYGI